MSIINIIPKYIGYDIGTVDTDKVSFLIDELGLEGLGIFTLLNEKLASKNDHKLHINYINILARKYNSSRIKIEQVITGYGLFQVDKDGNIFWSDSLNDKIEIYSKSINQRRLAGKASAAKRAENKRISTVVERSLNGSSTIKLNKTKLNNTINSISKNKQKENLPTELNIEAYEMWLEYKGSKYTQRGKTLSINKLTKFNKQDQLAMVENSILCNYKGLFEIKNKQSTNNQQNTENLLDNYFAPTPTEIEQYIDVDIEVG